MKWLDHPLALALAIVLFLIAIAFALMIDPEDM